LTPLFAAVGALFRISANRADIPAVYAGRISEAAAGDGGELSAALR